jgi:hypothetical protein
MVAKFLCPKSSHDPIGSPNTNQSILGLKEFLKLRPKGGFVPHFVWKTFLCRTISLFFVYVVKLFYFILFLKRLPFCFLLILDVIKIYHMNFMYTLCVAKYL